MNGLMISPEINHHPHHQHVVESNETGANALNLEELLLEPWQQQPVASPPSALSSSPSSSSSSSPILDAHVHSGGIDMISSYPQYSPASSSHQHYTISNPPSQLSHVGSGSSFSVDEATTIASTVDSGVYSYPPSSCSGSNSPKIVGPPSVDSYFDSMLAPSSTATSSTATHSNDFVNIDMMLDEPHSTAPLDLADLGQSCHGTDLNELLKDVFVENERMLSLDSAGSSASPCSTSSSPQLDEATATLLDSSLASSEADDDQETEALLDNIERMLNSMQDQQQIATTISNQVLPTQTAQNTVGRCATNIRSLTNANSNPKREIAIKPVKLEPLDNSAKALSAVSGNFKKISPKIAPNTGQIAAAKIQPAPSQPAQQQLAVLTTLPTTCSPIIIATAPATTSTTTTTEQAEPKSKRVRQSTDNVVKSVPAPTTTTTLILMPNTSPAQIKTQPLTPAAPIILNASSPAVSQIDSSNKNSNLDPNLIKKQNRMIKNRESACLSRKRKKEYLQSLEDNLKIAEDLNEQLKKENEELKEKLVALETENKQLKQQQQQSQQLKPPVIIAGAHKIASQTTVKTSPVNINLNALGIKTTGTNVGASTTTSLKRPFIMLAIFFVFGLNIFQFVNLNGSTRNELEPVNVYSVMQKNGQANYVTDTESAQLAALAMAQARDGALVDGSLLKHEVVALNSRHLLSEDYEDAVAAAEYGRGRRAVNASAGRANSTRVNGMDLVLINGTWHVIDLSICQQMFPNSTTSSVRDQYFNLTHFNRINNELDGWYKRYMLRSPFSNTGNKANDGSSGSSSSSSNGGDNEYEKYSASLLKNLNRPNNPAPGEPRVAAGVKTRPRFIEEARDRAKGSRQQQPPQEQQQRQSDQKQEEYAISLYDTQTHKHENFANSVRQRNDTFYFVSFRRDHVMYPAMYQNRSQRPRMSLLMPALLTSNLSASNGKNDRQQQQTIAFMQIDCEVVDTQLVHFNLNDIPMSYMKIIHQDYLANQDPTANKDFFNYYSSNSGF